MDEIFDVAIIGLGPAGVAAAVYSGRKKLKTLIIGREIGGQSVVSREIHNWIGIPKLPGHEMALRLYEHLETVADDVRVVEGENVQAVEKISGNGMDYFSVKTDEQEFSARTVLVASGSSRRKLGIPGEKEFSGNGAFYCSICDAPLMKGKSVAVVGGGNAGLEAVIDLGAYADKIYLLEITQELRGDQITQEKAFENGKVEVIFNARPLKILGEKAIEGLEYADEASNENKNLDLQGVFIEIGSLPNSAPVQGLVELDKFGQIIADPLSGRTSQEGIWAAGDVTALPYNQNNIAMGDAIRAILNIYDFLKVKKS